MRRTKKKQANQIGNQSNMNITDVQNDNPKLNPPYPLKKCEEILFGFDDTAYRGENPINPPVSKTDSYNWLRDETRKKNEVRISSSEYVLLISLRYWITCS